MLAKCAKTTFCCPRLVSILNVGAGANGCGSVLGCGALYSAPCTQHPVLYSGVAPPSTLLTVDDADQRPVRCQYAQYDQSRKRNAARKKGLEINCPFIFLPLFEYADVRKT